MTTATYKGRRYRVLFSGQTRYGHRTNLQFFNGKSSFWVDTAACTITVAEKRAPQPQPVNAPAMTYATPEAIEQHADAPLW